MPFNGSGTYNLPAGNPVVTGTTISSSTSNTTNSDIATALTNCLTRDGQSTPSANLPMSANKLTGLAAGTTAGDSVRYEQVLLLTGGTMTGAITFNVGQTISGYLPLAGGTMTGAITFAAGQTISGYLPTTGGTMTGNIVFASGQTVANLAAGSAGTIPYQSASGTTAMLSAGTSGQVLTSGGAGAPTWSTASGLTLGTPVASTSGSSIDFTGLPAGVKQITVTFSRVSIDTTATMVIRLGGSGSFATSGYNTGALKWISNVGTYNPATDGFLISSISSATQLSGTYIFTLENSSTNKWSGQGIFTTGDISPPTILMCAGDYSIDSTLTKIRVTTSGSSFDNGEINIAYQ